MGDNQKNRIVVGLDIGTNKVRAVVGQQNDLGRIEILGAARVPSEGVKNGVITNIERTYHNILSAIREVEVQSNTDIKVVNVIIPDSAVRSQVHKGVAVRKLPEHEITVHEVQALQNDMYSTKVGYGQYIADVVPQNYYLDGVEEYDPVGATGSKLEALYNVATCSLNAINNVNKVATRAQLAIEKRVLAPLASAVAVLEEEEKEAGVVLVDFGGGTTEIAIFHEKVLRHLVVLPVGSNRVTQDIKEGFNLLPAQAEQLKVTFGCAIPDETNPTMVVSIPGIKGQRPKEVFVTNLSHVIFERVKEIFSIVHEVILESGYDGKLGGGIVLTGGGAQLKSLDNLVSLITGEHVRVGNPAEHLGKGKSDQVKSPDFATAVGLVLSSFQNLDEREDEYERRLANPEYGQIRPDAPESGGVKVISYGRPAPQNHPDSAPRKESGNTRSGFSGIMDKLKGFIMDDIQDGKNENNY